MLYSKPKVSAIQSLMKMWAIVLLPISGSIAPVHAATPTETVFEYMSEPGDYIGLEGSNRYTPANAAISLSGTATDLTFSVSTATEFWYVELGAPAGEKLHPGRYYDAERAAFRTGRSPGLDAYGVSGCNQVWGGFAIHQIATDRDGKVIMLDASFLQRCESPTAPAFAGVVKFKAPPLSYAFRSDVGDYIGGGVSQAYYGDTTIFTLNGTDVNFQYTVSGMRDDWTVVVSAPSGKRLRPGTYPTAVFADRTHAGLDVFGDGRGCSSNTGTLIIDAITVGKSGNITSLSARFEQHCEGGAPALQGIIRYYR
jgi:hypothetical protein